MPFIICAFDEDNVNLLQERIRTEMTMYHAQPMISNAFRSTT